jgi:hypothetical protein
MKERKIKGREGQGKGREGEGRKDSEGWCPLN